MVAEVQPPEDQSAAQGPGLTAEPTTPAPDQAAAERLRLLEERARIEAQLRELTPADANEPFTRDTWGGRELFTCRYCPNTAFSEDAIRAHLDDDAYLAIHRQHPDFPG